jgi:hypothetical protein
MKLIELFEVTVKTIYHASSATFTKFLDRPTWFSTNLKDAKNWHASGEASGQKQTTYACEYTGGKIATEKQAEKIAKQVWPDDEFIYSMYDESVGEFDKADVKKFISLLVKSGFDAAYIEDYDPANFSSGTSRSLCVFHPNRTVKILRTELGGAKPAEPVEGGEYAIGDEVSFLDDAMRRHTGKVISFTKKGAPTPNIDSFDFNTLHPNDRAGKPAFKDLLFVKDERGRIHYVLDSPLSKIEKLSN